jgi:hypothetical protein
MKKNYLLIFLTVILAAAGFSQSDSARYLWNAGAYRYGDNFFRSDAPDTMSVGGRQIFVIDDAETTIVIPKRSLGTYEDSGGIKVYPRYATIQWNFPKVWEPDPLYYSFATIGIAPDEFQVAMEGNSEANRDICFYTRRNINLGIKIPDFESGDYKVQMVEMFNNSMSNAFDRFPFTIWCDRGYYGFGLIKFLDLRPGYPTMGHPRDSVIIVNIQIDTLFGAYGGPGSGYAKFFRGQVLDTIKFDIDVSGAYRIAGGTEVRPGAIETDSVKIKELVSAGGRFADSIYVNMATNCRYARYIPGLTTDYGCFLSLNGDNNDFVMLKGVCKKDSMVIRSSAGYVGYIDYLLYVREGSGWQEKALTTAPVYMSTLEIWPTVTKGGARMQYFIRERQHVGIGLYDTAGRKVSCLYDGDAEPGLYSSVLDLSALSQGVYFVRLEAGTEVLKGKAVIVK